MENKQIKTAENTSPAQMIMKAVAGGLDVEQLDKLLDVQTKWEANEARKAYNEAMAAFKSDPPKIDKDRLVDFNTQKGKVHYSHASLANVVEKISASLSKHGLSASWRTKQNGKIVVTCVITHAMGHSEETSLEADSDTSGSKNSIQAIGSTISYLQRYTLLSMTGLATHDMDDDSRVTVEMLDDKEKGIIIDLMAAVGIESKPDKFYSFLGVEGIDSIPKDLFTKAKTALEAKMKEKK